MPARGRGGGGGVRVGFRTRLLLGDQADALDGPVLLELAPQLLLGGLEGEAAHEQRLEGVALRARAAPRSPAGAAACAPRGAAGGSVRTRARSAARAMHVGVAAQSAAPGPRRVAPQRCAPSRKAREEGTSLKARLRERGRARVGIRVRTAASGSLAGSHSFRPSVICASACRARARHARAPDPGSNPACCASPCERRPCRPPAQCQAEGRRG